METTIKNWTISLNDRKTELTFSDGLKVCYAFYDMKQDVLFFDKVLAPKYAINRAKKWAKENGMIDIYNY